MARYDEIGDFYVDRVGMEAGDPSAAAVLAMLGILHPCFPGWDETAPSSWPRAGGYRAEGWWLADNPGFRGKVGANHRMLSTYVNTLARHGLAIEELAEPEATPDVLARQALAQPGAGSLPMFLVARCARLPARG